MSEDSFEYIAEQLRKIWQPVHRKFDQIEKIIQSGELDDVSPELRQQLASKLREKAARVRTRSRYIVRLISDAPAPLPRSSADQDYLDLDL